jgi:hypothetical protein
MARSTSRKLLTVLSSRTSKLNHGWEMREEKLEFVYELEGNLETLDVFDLATVQLREKQTVSGSKVSLSYEILEVVDYRPAYKDQPVPDSSDE